MADCSRGHFDTGSPDDLRRTMIECGAVSDAVGFKRLVDAPMRQAGFHDEACPMWSTGPHLLLISLDVPFR